MSEKYPTPAQKASGYLQTKEIIARQYVRAFEKSAAAWLYKSPKYQQSVDEMILYGSSTYLVTTEDADTSIADVGKYLPRLP